MVAQGLAGGGARATESGMEVEMYKRVAHLHLHGRAGTCWRWGQGHGKWNGVCDCTEPLKSSSAHTGSLLPLPLVPLVPLATALPYSTRRATAASRTWVRRPSSVWNAVLQLSLARMLLSPCLML